jgi:hypothetical protein
MSSISYFKFDKRLNKWEVFVHLNRQIENFKVLNLAQLNFKTKTDQIKYLILIGETIN